MHFVLSNTNRIRCRRGFVLHQSEKIANARKIRTLRSYNNYIYIVVDVRNNYLSTQMIITRIKNALSHNKKSLCASVSLVRRGRGGGS